ncbi:MAG TPA: hypothetical protein VJ901_16435, partial [Thermoanaerobaculia bacterium]|nr:hypothetical protein [Thermoanaerobaculia bacterium]
PDGGEKTADANCGKRGTFLCPMRSFYYLRDAEFIREVGQLFESMREENDEGPPAGGPGPLRLLA